MYIRSSDQKGALRFFPFSFFTHFKVVAPIIFPLFLSSSHSKEAIRARLYANVFWYTFMVLILISIIVYLVK